LAPLLTAVAVAAVPVVLLIVAVTVEAVVAGALPVFLVFLIEALCPLAPQLQQQLAHRERLVRPEPTLAVLFLEMMEVTGVQVLLELIFTPTVVVVGLKDNLVHQTQMVAAVVVGLAGAI
jgi:hypothetical protein